MSKGQAAIETIIIFSISALITLVLVSISINSQAGSDDILRLNQARSVVNDIASTANKVWSQGEGARIKLLVIIPEGINESDSGIISDYTINLKVNTKGGYTDVSSVSSVPLVGDLPLSGGSYDLIITSMSDHVTISYLSVLGLTTDAQTYSEGGSVNYYVNALSHDYEPRTTNVTVQLIDTNGVVRDEQNKTTEGGLTNGTLSIPVISDYGYWRVYAFDNETYDFKGIIVVG